MDFVLRRWFLLVTAAESVGFLIPVAGMAITPSIGASAWLTPVAMAVFGAGEGAMLGLGQATALRGTRVEVPPARWVIATAGAAALAWLLGMMPSTLHDLGADFGNPLLWAALAVGGVILLLSIPTAQYLVLRETGVPGALWWIPVNVGAWMLGLTFTMLPMPLIDESTPAASMAVVFAVAGVCMAATVALITGLWWRSRAKPAQQSETCSSLGV